jgi:signal transduction histidine kinase
MRLALKEEQARRSRFIMGVSHDLKTPLALIKGYTEAISDGLADDPEMMKKSLEIVGNKVNQLEEMIDDLIGFVKLNTGEWRQHLQNHAIEPLLSAFVRRITSDAELLGRRVEHRIELPASAIVPMDDRLFIRALENITMNAIRYTAEGGLIRIDARMEGRDALVSVSDNGSGISAEDLPHIFDLFYRGSSSRREDGMGLGLTVVRNVADSHGWEVSVSSEPGALTVFTLRIPVQASAPAKA